MQAERQATSGPSTLLAQDRSRVIEKLARESEIQRCSEDTFNFGHLQSVVE
jgi:hypothetical protein